MKEIWIDLPNFSRYEVSNTGKIRSINYKNSGRIQELKPAIDGGYYKTMIVNDQGKNRTVRIHRLVCEGFYGKIPKGKEVNHIDGNKLNNRIDNLEMITHSENVQHSFDNGLQKPLIGEDNPTSIYNENFVRRVKLEIEKRKLERGKFWGRRELAEDFGVKESFVKDLISGRCWKHILV